MLPLISLQAQLHTTLTAMSPPCAEVDVHNSVLLRLLLLLQLAPTGHAGGKVANFVTLTIWPGGLSMS